MSQLRWPKTAVVNAIHGIAEQTFSRPAACEQGKAAKAGPSRPQGCADRRALWPFRLVACRGFTINDLFLAEV